MKTLIYQKNDDGSANKYFGSVEAPNLVEVFTEASRFITNNIKNNLGLNNYVIEIKENFEWLPKNSHGILIKYQCGHGYIPELAIYFKFILVIEN